jgi:hypothetical protein
MSGRPPFAFQDVLGCRPVTVPASMPENIGYV